MVMESMKIHNGGASNAWQSQMATAHVESERASHWTYDRNATHQGRPKSVDNSRDKKQDGDWACREWQPTIRPQEPMFRKSNQHFAAGALLIDRKGACMEKLVNGSVEKLRISITLHELHVCCRGTCFYFRKLKGRGTTVFDSRSPKTRRSLDFVRSELLRMCGDTLGTDLFNQLLNG